MSAKPLTDCSVADQVQGVALAFGGVLPAEALAQLLQGCDPRYDTSPLYDLVFDIDKEDERMPTEPEWQRIRDMVLDNPDYRRARVGVKEVLEAAKVLMKYMHPALRSIEVTGDSKKPIILGDISDADHTKLLQVLKNV